MTRPFGHTTLSITPCKRTHLLPPFLVCCIEERTRIYYGSQTSPSSSEESVRQRTTRSWQVAIASLLDVCSSTDERFSTSRFLHSTGTAPLAPSPSTLHPNSVIDAAPGASGLSQGMYAGTKLAGIIGPSSADQASQGDVVVFDAIKTIAFDAQKNQDHAQAVSDLANQDVVRIDIEQLAPFVTESEWDALEELVLQLSKPAGEPDKNKGTTGLEGMMAKIGEPETQLGLHVQEPRKRVILIGAYFLSSLCL